MSGRTSVHRHQFRSRLAAILAVLTILVPTPSYALESPDSQATDAPVPETPLDSQQLPPSATEAVLLPPPTESPVTQPEPPPETVIPPQENPVVTPPLAITAPAAAISPPVAVVQPVIDKPPTSPIIVSAFQTTNALGFIELYNNATSAMKVEGWRVEVHFTNGEACNVALHDVILSKQQVLLVRSGTMATVNARSYDCGSAQLIVKQLRVINAYGEVVDELTPPLLDTSPQVWQRKGLTATYLKGNFANDFKELARTVVDGEWYRIPAAPTLTITEVLVNPRGCTPPDEAIDCYDYVKVVNTDTVHEVDLSQYRLRSGFSNSTVSSLNMAYLAGVIAPGEMMIIRFDDEHQPLSISANDGTVWFEDVEGIESYDMKVPPYVDSGLTSNKGLSWAFDTASASWRWGVPSPATRENTFPVTLQGNGALGSDDVKPCATNQYRSPETNRCRLIESASSTLTPCKEGQYRSEETNRCRSIASVAAAALKPCADNQFRNPATNRCKSIASVDDVSLADCGEGRERNPETNRCRNVKSAVMPVAAFPVEEVKQTGQAFIGWWALGGVGIIAVGYAAWEWRREIVSLTRRVGTFFTSKK